MIMRCITRSSRRRKSRSRLSRSTRRPVMSSRHSGAISKRRSSRFDHSAGFEAVSKELNFGNAENSSSFTASMRGMRRDRCLQNDQENLSLPTETLDATYDDNSLKEDYAGGDLAKVQLVPGDDNRIIESLFGEIFDNASIMKVEVEQCVSLPELRTRPLRNFGIMKAVHLLRGNSIGSVTGHVCVGKFPVIAELPREYEERVLEYFGGKGREREASKRYMSEKKIYHVVNGGYEHEGRWRLIDEGQYQFSGIKWRTVCIKWQEPKVLRAISIMSSQVQKKEFVVELSFLDEMVYLRRIIQDHVNEHAIILDHSKPLPRGFCKDICKSYSGGADYSNNTLRHLVSIASKISMRTMLMIREAIDEECPNIASSIHKKSHGEDPSDIFDTRVFRTLINSKTLRGAKNFLTAETSDEDRLNALHRLRYVAQESGRYKGVDAKTLEAQLDAAIAGRKSIENFKVRILKEEPWPVGVRPLLQNILRTTKLDDEVNENARDPDVLLESLKMKYLDCAGSEGGCRVEQYEKFVQDRMRAEIAGATKNCDTQEPVHESPSSNESAGGLNVDSQELLTSFSGSANDGQELLESSSEIEDAYPGVQPSGSTILQSSENASLTMPSGTTQVEEYDEKGSEHQPEPVSEVDILERLNIAVHAMSFEDYNRMVLTEQEIFDLVISDPFQKAASAQSTTFSSERRIAFIQFIKKVLVPGGHAFLILPQLEMSEWLENFDNFEMNIESVFLLLKDPEHVQRVKGKSFQNLMEVAAVARKPGRHPTRFTMDTISPYTQLPRNTYKRKAPVIDHISPPSNRLRFPGTKALVRTAEKSPALFWELMKTFCPAGGKVLDPFAATLTVGIAGIQTGRSCVLLETDRKCLSLAEERLRELATKHLEDGQATESSRVVDMFKLQKEGYAATEDVERQGNTLLNDSFTSEVEGAVETQDTVPNSTSQDAEQNIVENLQSDDNEHRPEPRESESSADSVSDSDELHTPKGARCKGSARQSDSVLPKQVPEVTTSDPESENEPKTPVNSAREHQSNVKDSETTLASLINTRSGNTPTETDKVLVGEKPQSNMRRPQRNRKKTSRYA